MTEQSAETPPLEDVMTLPELSEYLGIAPRLIVNYSDLKTAHVGRTRLYFKKDVAAWLYARRR